LNDKNNLTSKSSKLSTRPSYGGDSLETKDSLQENNPINPNNPISKSSDLRVREYTKVKMNEQLQLDSVSVSVSGTNKDVYSISVSETKGRSSIASLGDGEDEFDLDDLIECRTYKGRSVNVSTNSTDKRESISNDLDKFRKQLSNNSITSKNEKTNENENERKVEIEDKTAEELEHEKNLLLYQEYQKGIDT